MSLTEILEAVADLSPSERERVAEVLLRSEAADRDRTVSERQHELHLRLIEKGLLKRIPDRSLRPSASVPVKIKGKPLSETIIEERR